MEEATINLTIKLPELTQDWETDSWRAQRKLVCTRTQEKGAVTTRETHPDLPVSWILQWKRGLVEACCRVRGTECSSASWDLLKEVTTVFITSTIVWPQVK